MEFCRQALPGIFPTQMSQRLSLQYMQPSALAPCWLEFWLCFTGIMVTEVFITNNNNIFILVKVIFILVYSLNYKWRGCYISGHVFICDFNLKLCILSWVSIRTSIVTNTWVTGNLLAIVNVNISQKSYYFVDKSNILLQHITYVVPYPSEMTMTITAGIMQIQPESFSLFLHKTKLKIFVSKKYPSSLLL